MPWSCIASDRRCSHTRGGSVLERAGSAGPELNGLSSAAAAGSGSPKGLLLPLRPPPLPLAKGLVSSSPEPDAKGLRCAAAPPPFDAVAWRCEVPPPMLLADGLQGMRENTYEAGRCAGGCNHFGEEERDAA